MKKITGLDTLPNELSSYLDIDTGLLANLSLMGVFDAAHQIGLDVDRYLVPLAQHTNHNYRHYRWSVGHYPGSPAMISALPPEEELGWTPWERWYKDEQGITRKDSWVLYPLKNPTSSGIANWYKLDEHDLMPRYVVNAANLENKLRQARIHEASVSIGFDIDEVLIKPLSEKSQLYYQLCRWVVIPHILSGDGPVIYILPPMQCSDEWPWESWYTDGTVKLIHHVHFTKQNKHTTGTWREYHGAPQRPPEIFGVNWYWYDDKDLKPTMADL